MDLPCYVLIKSETLTSLNATAGLVRESGLSAGKGYTRAASLHISAIIFSLEDDGLSGLALLLGCSSRPFMSVLFSQSHLLLPSEDFLSYPSFLTPPFFIPMPFFPFVLHLLAISILLPLSSMLYLAFILLPAFSTCFSFAFYHI